MCFTFNSFLVTLQIKHALTMYVSSVNDFPTFYNNTFTTPADALLPTYNLLHYILLHDISPVPISLTLFLISVITNNFTPISSISFGSSSIFASILMFHTVLFQLCLKSSILMFQFSLKLFFLPYICFFYYLSQSICNKYSLPSVISSILQSYNS